MARQFGAYGRGAVFASMAAACIAPASLARAQEPNPVVLEGADAATLHAIALTLPARDPPQSLFDAERLADEAAGRAEAWMRSEGYYAGVADAVAEDEPPRARVKISLGSRFNFAAPKLEYSGAAPDAHAADLAQLAMVPAKQGAPARAGDVLASEAGVVSSLQGNGYADAVARTRQAIVDHATGEMSVTFRVEAGAAVVLGAARLEAPLLVKQSYIEKLARWRPGDRYTPEALSDLRRDLSSTGAFSRVTVQLAEPDNGQRDVVVRLEFAKRHTIELGAAYSTTEGAGVNGTWTRRNAFGHADPLSVQANVAENEQTLAVSLWRPHAISPGRHLRYTLSGTHEDTTAYERTGGTASVAVEVDPNVRRALIYGGSVAADRYQGSTGVSNAVIASVYGGFRLDYSDSRFDPRTGSVLELRAEPTVTTGSATTTFLRLTGTARGYLSPNPQLTLAARVGAGWVAQTSGEQANLPLDRLFYAGGGGSVRGYAYKSIYPVTNSRTDPPGGVGLLETSLEARWRVKGPFGAAAFIDGGSAFNDFGDAADMRWGAGVGVRYDLGFAPVRLDIATPLNKRPGDPSFSIYASLGQAF